MKIVNPNDLKIGDKIRFISRKGWKNSNCDCEYCGTIEFQVGEVYQVKNFRTLDKSHIAGNSATQNPVLYDKDENRMGSAWWGTFEYVDKEIYNIAKFMRGELNV